MNGPPHGGPPEGKRAVSSPALLCIWLSSIVVVDCTFLPDNHVVLESPYSGKFPTTGAKNHIPRTFNSQSIYIVSTTCFVSRS